MITLNKVNMNTLKIEEEGLINLMELPLKRIEINGDELKVNLDNGSRIPLRLTFENPDSFGNFKSQLYRILKL